MLVSSSAAIWCGAGTGDIEEEAGSCLQDVQNHKATKSGSYVKAGSRTVEVMLIHQEQAFTNWFNMVTKLWKAAREIVPVSAEHPYDAAAQQGFDQATCGETARKNDSGETGGHTARLDKWNCRMAWTGQHSWNYCQNLRLRTSL